jgi:hypothetical protein
MSFIKRVKEAIAAMPTIICCCMFIIFDTEAIIYKQWWMESKWLKKQMYEYQQSVKGYNWCILIILYILYSEQRGHCSNAHIFWLLDVHIWHGGNHLSTVMNGVKVTEEAYVWVPAVCQMV